MNGSCTLNPGRAFANPPLDPAARIHQYHAEGAALVDGYAPFCKHVFVPNFVGAKAGAMPVSLLPTFWAAVALRQPTDNFVSRHKCSCIPPPSRGASHHLSFYF